MTTLTERLRESDFLKHFYHPEYCFESKTIKNNSGVALSAGAFTPGLPLLLNSTQWETVAAGSVSGMDGFYIGDGNVPSEALAIGATSTAKYRILARGPAIVNLDAVPVDLDAGTAYTLATIRTAMTAFSPPILDYREPTQTTTQTT